MQPEEIITSPFTIWIAPVGTAFPALTEEPGEDWTRIGSNGTRSYSEGGVTTQHSQQREIAKPAGSTAPTYSFSSGEEFRIRLELLDLTLEQYALALGQNAVSATSGVGELPGYRTLGLNLRPRADTVLALLARGPSPYDEDLIAQFEVPRCQEAGSGPKLIFRKGKPAGVAVDFLALEDPNAASIDELFGRLHAQDFNAFSPPAFTTLPSITGTAAVGETVTLDLGAVDGGDIDSAALLRGETTIDGDPGATYDLVLADAGEVLSLVVVASGPGGEVEATSADFGPVTNDLAIASLSRPTLALAEFYNAFGDSTTNGVGAGAGQSWPQAFRDIATGQTAGFHGGTGGNNGTSIEDIGNGGVGGENSASITARITALDPTYATELARTSFYCAGLNDYDSGVSGWSRNWPAQVKSNYATGAAALTGSKRMIALLAPADNDHADGNEWAADHRFHFFEMVDTYGELAFDLARYLRFVRQLDAPSGTADADALAQGGIPYTFRGSDSSTDFANYDAASISGSGAPSDLNYDEGTIYWRTGNNSSYRKLGASGAGSWELVDTKHFSQWGYDRIARLAGDIAIAEEGDGPPVCPPARFRITADAANGAAVGTVDQIGTATAFALRTYDDEAVTDFAISSSGAITKATASALTEGVTELVVVAQNANGVLLSPVDIYVARPSTETAPELRPIASPYISVAGRAEHGMTDGKQISGAFYFNTSAIGANQQLALLTKTGAPNQPFSLQISSSGNTRILAYDAANTLVANLNIGTHKVTAGSPFWILFALDFATDTRCAYLTEDAQTVASITNGSDIQMEEVTPRFLNSAGVREYYNGANPFTGSIGFMALWDDYIDWTNATNRRALFDVSGNPATRTPFAAIDSVVPQFELWGGKGDWLWGSPDGSADAKLLSISHRARTLMS